MRRRGASVAPAYLQIPLPQALDLPTMQLFNKSTRGQRTTAVLSTLAAVAILGAAVTADPAGTKPTTTRLMSLESDLRFQLEMTYRHDGGAKANRFAALEATLEAWRRSPQSQRDERALVEWMRASISRSVPGELRELPATPAFGTEEPSEGGTHRSTAAEPATIAPRTQPAVTQPTAAPPVVQRVPPREDGLATPAPSPPPAVAPTASAPTLAGGVAVQQPKVVEPSGEESITVRKVPAADSTPTRSLAESHEGTPPPTAAVQVNLSELNARIGGYHDGLRQLEAAVVAAGDGMTTEQMTRWVAEAEHLAQQYRFARLYHDSLTERERLFVMEPRSMQSTIDLLRRQHASIARGDEDFLASLESDEGDELAEQLRSLEKQLGE